MSSNAKTLLVTTGFIAGLAASFAAGVSTARQPAMQNALDNLQQARVNLQNASSDKGGHRVEAIKWVDGAIAHVRAGIVAGIN